jgi:hypothetical protein
VGGAGIIAVSLVLAAATHHAVERPVLARGLGVGPAYRLGAACTAAVLVVAALWQLEATRRASVEAGVGDARHPGAVALVSGPVEPAPLLPPPVAVYDDWAGAGWDCVPMSRFPSDVCVQPVEVEPSRRVVVVGDSHAQQLIAALEPIAATRGWQLASMLYGACPFSTVSEVDPDNDDCVSWNDAAAAELVDLGATSVVTLGSRDVRVGLTEQTPPGFVDRWRQLDELGISVLAVRDNPRFDFSMPDCAVQGDPAQCGAARAELYAEAPPWTVIDDVPGNVTFLDVADAICEADFCPAAIGNVLVYMDHNHLSATYSASMVPLIEAEVVAALDR